VRYISFGDNGMSDAAAASAAGQIQRHVAYFFHTNGSYTSDSAVVRFKLQNLRAKYGYYAKVELMVQSNDRDEAAKSMQDFLRDALPQVEQCLPAWDNERGMPKGVQ
jgi:Arc/MetJ-type ribon-helix-helix transcriptional regulator